MFKIAFLLFSSLTLFSVENPLTPQTPVVINNTSFGVFSTCMPIVGVNADGYMVTYTTFPEMGGDTQMAYSFSENGSTWITGVIISPSSTQATIWNVGTSAGFLTSFPYPPPGAPSVSAQSSFSSDQGGTWTSFTVIDAGPNITFNSPISSIAVTGGVIATWRESGSNFTSFSSDNGSTWSPSVKIGTSNTTNTHAILSFNSSGLLATWRDTTDLAAKAAFSSDLGATWSAEATIISNVGGSVFCSANDEGFIAVWVDFNLQEVRSSFSIDQGATWSSPTTITNDLSANTNARAFVTANDEGFIATWIDSSGNANASFSDDNGLTWSDPVLITDDGSVDLSNTSIISAICQGSSCVFTWRQNATFNVMASLSASAPNPPTGLSGVQKKNDFGLQFELFNLIRWNASSSPDVSGYNVYRDGIKIATVSQDTLFFNDHNQPKGVQRAYAVTSLNGNGGESDAVTVVVNPR